MPILHFLGTGAALSDPHRTTTMLALEDAGETLVIDCGGDVGQRLMAAGVDLKSVTGLIVTHEHPDHVSGLPLFLAKLYLLKRAAPLPIYGIPSAIAAAKRYVDAAGFAEWDAMPKIAWTPFGETENARVIDSKRWHITASPVQHSAPCVGLRMEHKATGAVVAYSCDTEPTDAVTRLGRDADLLIHEATGATRGHSSAQQAAAIARDAGAKRLLLVHVPPGLGGETLAEAQETFAMTEIAEEGGQIVLR